MNKTVILAGIACFLSGVFCGFLISPETEKVRAEQAVLTEFTSQGRAEIQKMISDFNLVLKESGAEIIAEETQALQAVSSKKNNRDEADFYLLGKEDKMKSVQSQIDKILFDGLQRMPLMDRETYMRLFLKKRPFLKMRSVVLPFIVKDSDCLISTPKNTDAT